MVLTIVGFSGAVYCSIECARHSGEEPYRFPLPDEYDAPCSGCGFENDDTCERCGCAADPDDIIIQVGGYRYHRSCAPARVTARERKARQ